MKVTEVGMFGGMKLYRLTKEISWSKYMWQVDLNMKKVYISGYDIN